MSAPTTLLAPAATPSPRSKPATGIVLAIAALVLLAHLPLVFTLFREHWFKPHYQLFPIVLVGAFVLLWPLNSFSLSPPGPLRYSVYLMLAGGALLGIGVFAESTGQSSFGAPYAWIASSAILMLLALPLEILGGPTQSFAGSANPRAGLILVAISWCVLLYAAVMDGPAFATWSALGVIAAIPISIGGKRLFLRCLPGLAYLLLILPPPYGLDAKLVQNLQLFAAKFSSRVLDFIGVHHYLNGITIEVGEQRFMVEDGCSGISSLLSTSACVLFFILWYRIHWLRGSILALSTVFWVLVNNTARIVGITFFGVGFNLFGGHRTLNLSTGLPHQLFGVLLFVITLGMLWCTDRFLMFVSRADLPKRRTEPLPATAESLQSSWTQALTMPGVWYRSAGVGAAFALLAIAQAAEIYGFAVRTPYSGSALSKLYEDVDLATMPTTIGPWTRASELRKEQRPPGNPMGEFSRIWSYNSGPQVASLSLDYPYPEFHDMRVCYQMLGWKFDPNFTEVDRLPIPNKPDQQYIRARMEQPGERFATLWYCSFDQDGVGVEPVLESDVRNFEEKNLSERFAFRLRRRMERWQEAFGPTENRTVGTGSILQVQLLVLSHQKLPDSVERSAEQLFKEGVVRLRNKCVELKSRPNR